jgi:hypothetical protein
VASAVNLGQTNFTEIAFASKSKAAVASLAHQFIGVLFSETKLHDGGQLTVPLRDIP